jgi:hypothetical protein
MVQTYIWHRHTYSTDRQTDRWSGRQTYRQAER